MLEEFQNALETTTKTELVQVVTDATQIRKEILAEHSECASLFHIN